MSKKRGRSDENHGARGVAHGPDPAIEAEGLLFELALDDNENSATTGGQLDSKRIKTKAEDSPNNTAEETITESTAPAGTEAASISCPQHAAAIVPSASLRLCDGFDIVRKGRGRGRQLMVMPGTLGIGGVGGKLGTLENVTTTSPVLYMEFPQGRLKCTGRTVHTKGRFFTLYADKTGSKATRMDCRDVFDSIVFFSSACWVGKREDNPKEEALPLPEDLQSLPKDPDTPDAPPAEFKTYFGGGNPNTLLAGGSSKRSGSTAKESGTMMDGIEGDDDAAQGETEKEGQIGKEEAGGSEGDALVAEQPTRRSSGRTRKAAVKYMEDSEDSEDGGGGGGGGSVVSSSSDEASDDEGTGGRGDVGGEGNERQENGEKARENEEGENQEQRNGGEDDHGDSAEENDDNDNAEESDEEPKVSVMDAPAGRNKSGSPRPVAARAKKTPSTASKGKRGSSSIKKKPVASAATKRARKTSGGSGARFRSKKKSPSISDSSDGEGSGGDSGEETPASVEDDDNGDGGGIGQTAEPSRRSRRSSAVARIKYTQSSESEVEEENDSDDDNDDDDDE